jgi:zinc transport system substrate-binding protein
MALKKSTPMHLIRLFLLFLAAVLLNCSKPQNTGKHIIFVTIPTQKYFVERIAGNRFTVFTLIGDGQNPHSFTPSAEQMARLSEASIFFRIGVESETAIINKVKQTMPSLKLADLRNGIKMLEMAGEHNHDEEAEPGHAMHGDDHNMQNGGHHHEEPDSKEDAYKGKDPHIWLSISNVKKMGVTIKEALLEADPAGKEVYETNLESFVNDMDSVDAKLREILAPLKGSYLFVYHPAFGYFAQEYGLIQKAVETGGKEPGAKALARLIDQARTDKPKVILVQPQYSEKSARLIAEQIGCAVVSINPQPENYFAEIMKMAQAIQAGYGK